MNAPQSHMPPAARRQVAEANRLIAELNKPPAAPSDPPAVPAVAAPAEPEFATIEIAPPATAAAPPPVAPVAPVEESDKTATQLKVLRGKYNKETAELRAQLQDQQRTINSLAMAQAARAAEPPPAAPLKPEERFSAMGVSKQEIEAFGPDLISMMERVAQGSVTPEIKELLRTTGELKQQLAQTQQTTFQAARQALYSALGAAVPNWTAVNDDENFLAWLQEVDVFSGSSRNTALQAAFNTNDVARVVGIFQAYVGKTPIPAPRATATVDRGTLVAPGQPRGAAMEAPDGNRGRILSEQEIGDFYARVRRKQVTPEEYQKFAAEIALATAEGRVKPTHTDFHQNGR